MMALTIAYLLLATRIKLDETDHKSFQGIHI